MSHDSLEEAWQKYAEMNTNLSLKEMQSPINFVRYLLERNHVSPGWFRWGIIVQILVDIVYFGLFVYIFTSR